MEKIFWLGKNKKSNITIKIKVNSYSELWYLLLGFGIADFGDYITYLTEVTGEDPDDLEQDEYEEWLESYDLDGEDYRLLLIKSCGEKYFQLFYEWNEITGKYEIVQ